MHSIITAAEDLAMESIFIQRLHSSAHSKEENDNEIFSLNFFPLLVDLQPHNPNKLPHTDTDDRADLRFPIGDTEMGPGPRCEAKKDRYVRSLVMALMVEGPSGLG